jgi:hypothetical protein
MMRPSCHWAIGWFALLHGVALLVLAGRRATTPARRSLLVDDPEGARQAET